LGFATIGAASWANEPLSSNCGEQCASGCPECPDNPMEIYCATDMKGPCGCDCEPSRERGCGPDGYYYDCFAA
jgi:hypothetical protein